MREQVAEVQRGAVALLLGQEVLVGVHEPDGRDRIADTLCES